MRQKIFFTKKAAEPNVAGKRMPSFINEEGIICKLDSFVHQFSQLIVKSGWNLWLHDGKVYSFFHKEPEQKKSLMAGIIGDESPLSYLQAAICYHKLLHFTNGRGERWDVKSLVDDSCIRHLDLLGEWPFELFSYSLNPVFFYDSLQHPVVVFYTFTNEGSEVIYKHIHRFDYSSYELKWNEKLFASSKVHLSSWNRLSRDHYF